MANDSGNIILDFLYFSVTLLSMNNTSVERDPKYFVFHTDPGHGWLEVTMEEVKDVGLSLDSFTECSYRERNLLFLEEDCDAPRFIEAYRAKYGKNSIRFCDKYSEDAFVRELSYIR